MQRTDISFTHYRRCIIPARVVKENLKADTKQNAVNALFSPVLPDIRKNPAFFFILLTVHPNIMIVFFT